MDQHRVDALTRTLRSVPSRRDVLRGLAAIGIGLGTARLPAPVAGETPSGCRKVGDRCKRADQCCSGICTGKPGKKKCRAHGTGTCDQKIEGICTTPDLLSVVCNNRSNCGCFRTTAGSNFCAELLPPSQCVECTKDADCVALGLPAGTACAPVSAGRCAGQCPSGMACLYPCGSAPEE
jgi:hypothetical protein